jgi:epoxide hydrolase-like predicted phosphatase
MAIRAVIWDLGGVFLRTEDYAPRTAAAQRLGMSRQELENLVFSSPLGIKAQLGQVSAEQHWESLRQILGLTADEMVKLRRDFWGGDRLDNALISDVRALRSAYKIGLLSNAFSDLREYLTEAWRFADIFDEMIISAEVGMMKPGAQIFQLTLDRLHLHPNQAVFIDDTVQNVAGAQALHIHAIHFQSPDQVMAELRELLGKY